MTTEQKKMCWRAVFVVRKPVTGEVVAENDITAAGIGMTLALWNADTTERFHAIRLEDDQEEEIATATTSRTYEVDESGADPVGIFTTAALFAAEAVSAPVAFAALIGSEGTVIGKAALVLPADQAYEIKRFDYLGDPDAVAAIVGGTE